MIKLTRDTEVNIDPDEVDSIQLLHAGIGSYTLRIVGKRHGGEKFDMTFDFPTYTRAYRARKRLRAAQIALETGADTR